MAETAETLIIKSYDYSHLGGTVLRAAGIEYKDLGVNDPNSHLAQYFEHGESALEFIEEDLITDCGERMVDAKFINQVDFRRVGSDFLSEKGNFSMINITAGTKQKMDQLKAEPLLKTRAEIEARLPYRLLDWLPTAEADEALVEESMPLADDESYAVSRFYRKLSEDDIRMYVIVLHSPTVTTFNKTREKIGAGVQPSVSADGLLENVYSIRPKYGSTFEELIEEYVEAYDRTLTEQNPRQVFVFGMLKNEAAVLPDSLEVVRSQKSLLNIYKDTVKALAKADWAVTKELIDINFQLGLGIQLVEGDSMNLEDSRVMLDGTQQFILATLNRASQGTLEMLAVVADSDSGVAYGVAGHYGNEARSEGVRYENPACPTVLNMESAAEQVAIQKAFRLEKDPTKCILCPACKKIVDLPKKLSEKKILHCVKCKASAHKDGGKVDQKLIDEYYGSKDKAQKTKKETEWQRIVRGDNEKKALQKQKRTEKQQLNKAA